MNGLACIAMACCEPSFAGISAEDDGGAAEHDKANLEEVRSVDDIIAELAEERGERAQSILAAALAVREARGRGRKDTLRKEAREWGNIAIRRKVDGRWKDRGLDDIQQDIVKALSQATTACMAKAESNENGDEHAGSATAASRSAGPGASSSACSGAQPRKKQRVFAEGEVTGKRPREIPTEPTERGAAEHEEGGAEHEEGADADECIHDAGKQDEGAKGPSGCARRVRARGSGWNLGTEGEELVAFAWLEERSTEPRAKVLLEQIREWRGARTREAKRALIQRHAIRITRAQRQDADEFRAVVGRHFLDAVAQERGRARAFAAMMTHAPVVDTGERKGGPSGAAEHIDVVDVTNMQQLRLFRRQHPEMPHPLRKAVFALTGGANIPRQTVDQIVKDLGIARRSVHRIWRNGRTAYLNETIPLLVARLRMECFRRVRVWAATALPMGRERAAGEISMRTPRSTREFASMLRTEEGFLRAPFGVDFVLDVVALCHRGHTRTALQRVPWWLALLELNQVGYTYGVLGESELPYRFVLVMDILYQRRQERAASASEHGLCTSADLSRALIGNPVFWSEIGTHDLFVYGARAKGAVKFNSMATRNARGALDGETSLLEQTLADEIASDFFEFVIREDLREALRFASPEHMQVLAVFLRSLQNRPPPRLVASERFDLIRPKMEYVPASAVDSPAVPHFAKVVDEESAPVIQAPSVCQLCGEGFLSPQGLWTHAATKHHSWAEYRKRLIFEVQRQQSVPLRPVEKRRLAGNFMHDLLHSYPSRNSLRPNSCTMRQVVACAVCAVKDWIEDFYPCYMFKDCPMTGSAAEHAEVDGEETEDGSEQKDVADAMSAIRRGPKLRDSENYCYFGPAERIHELLDVERYIPVVPLAPLEELHASSVQHPRFSHMRWLLHTKRVPVVEAAAAGDAGAQSAPEHEASEQDGTRLNSATEYAKPRCAGVGDLDKAAWLCFECAACLCCPSPKMPPRALANWNWGGREHPMYQNLTMSMRTLLGLGRFLMRLVLLKPQDDSDATEKALVGNTILVAQPAPTLIAAHLPPTEAQQAKYFNVIYGGAKEKLGEKKSLRVNRAEYLECARLRAERCPLFAAVEISEEVALAHLPEEGVPNGISRGAIEMATIEHFAPNLSGPATRGEPFRRAEDEGGEDDAAEAEEVEEGQDTVTGDAGCCRAPDALIADENANAEFLIGLDGSPDDDAVGKLASFRAKMALAEEAGKRLTHATLQVERTKHDARAAQQDTYASMDAVTDQAACAAEHRSVCVDLRSVARSMGTEFHDAIERSVTATYQRSSPAALRIQTGQPLSLFDPASWVACCVEFFYGDCVPNLDRPAKISWRRLFDYLMNREELEYH